MNRQIKFRGKRLDNSEWVYGIPIQTHIGLFIVTEENPHICDQYGYMEINEFAKVEPTTVGQFTGLRDRNGKEIYEGDILNNYDEPNPLTVKWDAGGCLFGLYNEEGDCECDFTSLEVRLGVAVDAEVVGNIHEQSKS